MSEVFEHLGKKFLDNKNNKNNRKNEEQKSQGPVATIKDINNANNPHKQIKLNAGPKKEDKKKKKGAFSWCSIL